jgi:hypothetical protein
VATDFTNETLDSVSRHCVTDLAAYRNAETERAISSVTVDKEKVCKIHLAPFMGEAEKFGPFPESQRGRKAETGRHQLLGGNLYRQTFPPFGATTFDNKTSVFRGHPDKKAVGSFSADITGLEGSFHGYGASPEECFPL